MKDSIGLRGKWSSPGGNSKRSKSSNLDLVMTWYFKKQQTLLIQGKDGNSVKEKLIKLWDGFLIGVRSKFNRQAACQVETQANYIPNSQINLSVSGVSPRIMIMNEEEIFVTSSSVTKTPVYVNGLSAEKAHC